MYKNIFLALITSVSLLQIELIISCKPKSAGDQAQRIVDLAIKAHGSQVFDESNVEFKFRNRNYKSSRFHGKYVYSRFWDSVNIVTHDELSNTGFIRHVAQTMVILDSKKIESYSNSVNAIFYFFALPFNLNDSAVLKEYLGETEINGVPYDKIKIKFKQNEADKMIHDDVYIYWFNKKNHYLDYLAYDYTEPNEKGYRFRKAINRRKINGLTIQDYINYKPIHDSVPIQVDKMDEAFLNNQLTELSKIINENVKVTHREK